LTGTSANFVQIEEDVQAKGLHCLVVLHVSISSAYCVFVYFDCYCVFCLSSLSVPAESVPATDCWWFLLTWMLRAR